VYIFLILKAFLAIRSRKIQGVFGHYNNNICSHERGHVRFGVVTNVHRILRIRSFETFPEKLVSFGPKSSRSEINIKKSLPACTIKIFSLTSYFILFVVVFHIYFIYI